jgi:hypothetical protein
MIGSQIREMPNYTTDSYPTGDLTKNIDKLKTWMPTLLQDFVLKLVSNATKCTAIGHCIVQCVRPNTVTSPLLFSIGVSLAHSFGSKWLLTLLSKLEFCLSYDEVVRYKQSVVQCGHDDLPVIPTMFHTVCCR